MKTPLSDVSDLMEPSRNIQQLLRREKWDFRFIELAKLISTWSKDNSTKCGAVVTTLDFRIVSMGFNGFPMGVKDDPEKLNDRAKKYPRIVHAEQNALTFSEHRPVRCQISMWPGQPCAACAKQIIQEGIVRVVAPITPPDMASRWAEENAIAAEMFEDAGVELVTYDVTSYFSAKENLL